MDWFSGPIDQAIKLSKTNKSLFVVLVESDKSESKDSVWKDTQVVEKFKTNKCVTLKLQNGTNIAKQFSDIYPVIIQPTIYFIGKNGQPLETRIGPSSKEEIISSLDKALKLNGSIDNKIAITTENTGEKEETKQENIEENSGESSSESRNNEEQNLKILRAKKLIEIKKIEKDDEELENEKVKELERRQLGREMGKFNDMKREMEKKEIEKELKRKRMEDKFAREKILRDIQHDREENEKRKNLKNISNQVTKQTVQESKNISSMSVVTRIQFRLPDGSTINNNFSPSDSLETTRTFLKEKIENRSRNFTLTCLFPRKVFTKDDYSKSLLNLDLTPSCVLIVTFDDSSSLGLGFFSTLWSKIFMFFGYIFSILIPSFRSIEQPTPKKEDKPEPAKTKEINIKKSTKNPENLRRRKEGNIHRLTADDEDDEQATWNGNSTQQM